MGRRFATLALCSVIATLGSPFVQSSFAGNAGTDIAVELDSLRPVDGLPSVMGGWVRYTYPMSVDCAPPPAGYAKSQRVYYLADCAAGALAKIRRISMDLNDRVVVQTEPDFNTPLYLPALGGPERTALRQICSGYAFRWSTRPPTAEQRSAIEVVPASTTAELAVHPARTWPLALSAESPGLGTATGRRSSLCNVRMHARTTGGTLEISGAAANGGSWPGPVEAKSRPREPGRDFGNSPPRPDFDPRPRTCRLELLVDTGR